MIQNCINNDNCSFNFLNDEIMIDCIDQNNANVLLLV